MCYKNYDAIAETAVKAREQHKTYGALQAEEYCKLSDMLMWKRYNEFKKRQNKKTVST